jgi:hypothetical protein
MGLTGVEWGPVADVYEETFCSIEETDWTDYIP